MYDLPYEEIGLSELDRRAIQPLFEKYGSWKWRFGREIPFTFECGERFPWGSVQIQLMVDGGTVKEAEVYSDSMDWSIAERLKAALEGESFSEAALCLAAETACPDIASDICRMIQEQEI